jgi:hypothetical protein
MITTVLKSNNQYSEILCVTVETSMRSYPGGERKAWPMRKLEAGAVQ